MECILLYLDGADDDCIRNHAGTRVCMLSITSLKLMRVNSLVAYGHKMVNDLFDGSIGFALDGGIKDAKLVPRGARNRYFFLT